MPSNSFGGDQLKQSSSGNPYQILHHIQGGSQITEDGDINQDNKNSHNGINFVARLQQFEHMQHQHRLHAKSHVQSLGNPTSTLTKVAYSFSAIGTVIEFVNIIMLGKEYLD